MPFFKITETVEYSINADTVESAAAKFDDCPNSYVSGVTDREVIQDDEHDVTAEFELAMEAA